MDRRIVKTREAIMKAYLDLITEKGTSRVSISELARRANIDRKTFYLHYNSVDDVLREYVENTFNRVVSVMEENHYFDNPFNAEMLVDLLDRFYKEEEELLLAVAGSDSYDDLWIKLHDILADKTKDIYAPLVNIDSGEINVFYDFFTAGVIDVYRRWSRGEYSYDLRHMVELIGGVVRTGLDPFLKEQLHKEVCLLLKKELQGENLLTIAVDNRIDYPTLPLGNLEDVWGSRGKNKIQKKANYPNFDFFNYCGITRPVRLLVMPESYIDDITIVPEVEYFEPLFALAHRQDPQKRPVSIASAQMAGGPDTDVSARLSDVICLNWYYGWYEGGPNLKEPAQPSLFCRKGQERRGVPE